jgi:hypothetical protein
MLLHDQPMFWNDLAVQVDHHVTAIVNPAGAVLRLLAELRWAGMPVLLVPGVVRVAEPVTLDVQ